MLSPAGSLSRARPRSPRYEGWRRRIFGITWLAYAGFYLTRKAFPVVKNELKKPEVLGLTTGQMSWMDTGNSVAYAAGQFVWGTLGDGLGTRRVILLGMLGSVTVTLFMGWSSTVTWLAILLALQGWFQSSGWAPLTKNIGEFFSQRERGSVMGFWCTNYAFGGFIGSVLAGWAAQSFGWRYAFFVPAAGLFAVWLAFLALQRNRPEDVGLPSIEAYHGLPPEAPAPRRAGAAAGSDASAVGEVLRNRMVWWLAAIYFLIKPTRYLILGWAPVYINERLGTGTAASGAIGAMFELAGPLGTLVGGLVSDRLFGTRRMPVSILALFLVGAVMMTFHLAPNTPLALGAGLFLIGFLIYIPDSLVSGAAAIDFGTKRGASTASGLINGCGSIGQIIGVSMPGWIDRFLAPGADKWNAIFWSLGCSLILAGLLLSPRWNHLPKGAARPEEPPGERLSGVEGGSGV